MFVFCVFCFLRVSKSLVSLEQGFRKEVYFLFAQTGHSDFWFLGFCWSRYSLVN